MGKGYPFSPQRTLPSPRPKPPERITVQSDPYTFVDSLTTTSICLEIVASTAGSPAEVNMFFTCQVPEAMNSSFCDRLVEGNSSWVPTNHHPKFGGGIDYVVCW